MCNELCCRSLSAVSKVFIFVLRPVGKMLFEPMGFFRVATGKNWRAAILPVWYSVLILRRCTKHTFALRMLKRSVWFCCLCCFKIAVVVIELLTNPSRSELLLRLRSSILEGKWSGGRRWRSRWCDSEQICGRKKRKNAKGAPCSGHALFVFCRKK